MVVIFLPATSPTETLHERTAAPSTWTVQAHWAMPQPYFVRSDRYFHGSPIEAGVGFDIDLARRPLMKKVTIASPPSFRSF